MNPPPVIIHVPHASTAIPPEYRTQFVLDDDWLARELDRITDHHTDALFALPPELAVTVSFPVSRLLVDPERFEDDALEPMAQRGMGVLYTRTTHQKPLRRELTAGEREELLVRYYRPHHRTLTGAVDDALAEHGRCLIIDAHSFPASPLPYELDQLAERPDYCIGTDPDHTPEALGEAAAEPFVQQGRSVLINRPFAGALVPMKHYRTDPRVSSVMIEVNRRLYLSPPDSSTRSERFEETKQAVANCLERLIEWASPGSDVADEETSSSPIPPVNAEPVERYPGLRETIRKYREAELPDCPKCGSGETAQVIVGVIGRTMLLAGATKKVHLRANDKPGEHYCNDCESYF